MSAETSPVPAYQPSESVLQNYADVLINFALNDGEGVQKDEVVLVDITDEAKPLVIPLQSAILEAGGHPVLNYRPSGATRALYDKASDDQLSYYNLPYQTAKMAMVDHLVGVRGSESLEMRGVPAEKIMRRAKAQSPSSAMMKDKENAGQLTWTLAMYGTPQLAAEAGMSTGEYWEQIISACFLDESDPITKWRETFAEIEEKRVALNALRIKGLHLESADGSDIRFSVGEQRQWVGGSGRNIPSFEVFTSPDWRGTNGVYLPNQPIYSPGGLINGVRLEFKDGLAVQASAEENEELLLKMIEQKDADKVGEYSLTDGRLSRITRFMANTLFDENVGGRYGNTHLAIGSSYADAYDGDPATLSAEDFDRLGFNNQSCTVHQDMISTTDRIVTAELAGGQKRVIYEDGQFTL